MTRPGLLLILLSAVLTVAANLLMRAGIDRAGGFPATLSEIPDALLGLARQPMFDIGFILYGLAALVWFRIVASQELSTAYPLLVSITFVFVTLGAALVFNETITWRKVIALTCIFAGIFIFGKE